MQKFNQKKVAILGFGIEGVDVYKFLQKEGAFISIFDAKEKRNLDCGNLNFINTTFYCGDKYDLSLLKNFDFIVRSPGFYRYLPEIVAAEKSGVLLTSPMNIFFERCKAKVIGVTGTKGKGTTSTLIYEILKKSGFNVYLSGNIGKPCLELLPKLKSNSWVVLELSSFQLIDLVKSPHISVVLNITLDHMDWHKDRSEYVNAKKSIVLHQKSGDFSVINADYGEVKKFAKLGSGKKYYFSKNRKVNGAYIANGHIYYSGFEKTPSVCSGMNRTRYVILKGNRYPYRKVVRGFHENNVIGTVQDLQLRGRHNWENVTAAICAARLAKATISSIKSSVFAFKGLEHRLELVGELNDVKFYNDSFSTNPQTTIAAVNSFTEPVTLILGGFDKNLNYDEMAKVLTRRKVANCILIGDIASKIKKSLLKSKYKGKIVESGYDPMDKIVKKALEISPKNGIILLSPATSSFDMFKDYKERGNKFKEVFKQISK